MPMAEPNSNDECHETHSLEQRLNHIDDTGSAASCEAPTRPRRGSDSLASNTTIGGNSNQQRTRYNKLKISTHQQEAQITGEHHHHHLHHCHQQGRYSQNPMMQVGAELSRTAVDYKNSGNKLCSVYRYDEAINCYTKAIEKDPEVPIFHSNRALCYLKLAQYQEAIQDCRRALELDPNLLKGHLFLGQALAEIESYDEALKHLQRAHELAKEKQLNFGDDMAYLIRRTKRRRWSKIEDENAKLEDELHDYLVELIQKDKETKIKQLTERPDIAQEGSSRTQRVEAKHQEPDMEVATAFAGTSNKEANAEVQRAVLDAKCDTYINKLDTIFNNLRLQQKKREVPDHLCGKISFEIMHDPVITPSGITYDRQDIEEHLRRVGHFDPITRQPLTSNQLISNLAMKEVVDAYLSENEWANYY